MNTRESGSRHTPESYAEMMEGWRSTRVAADQLLDDWPAETAPEMALASINAALVKAKTKTSP